MEQPAYEYAVATIGYGGCAAISADGRRRCSGFSESETTRYAPIVVNHTTAPYDQLAILSISGPLINPSLPPGTVRKLFGDIVPFDPTPDATRPPELAFLGNAHAFDEVDLETYIALAKHVGSTVTRAEQAA